MGPEKPDWEDSMSAQNIRRIILASFISTLLLAGAIVSTVHAQSGDVTYPESTFKDGKARFYQYKTTDGITIKYFILKSTDGVIRSAFDACDVCWPEGKGYEQKGDFMICRNCGKKFASTRVMEVQGGCNPGPLARKVEAGNVVIKVEDILKGRRYFDLKRGKS
jgi:uncharacterized membrane protein